MARAGDYEAEVVSLTTELIVANVRGGGTEAEGRYDGYRPHRAYCPLVPHSEFTPCTIKRSEYCRATTTWYSLDSISSTVPSPRWISCSSCAIANRTR